MKVSIIIPVYRVEPYIVRCIDSVLNQTYRCLEVILVDDCTPDSSMTIAREHIEQSLLSEDLDFVYLKHEYNRGLSAARNTGIEAATGDYIYFLDSDDGITDDCIELMVDAVTEEDGIEMVVGDIQQIPQTYDWPVFYIPGIHTTDIIELACSYRIYSMACNKLIQRHFLTRNNLYFKDGLYHEDELWNIMVACKLSKMKFIQNKTYKYFIRQGSIQSTQSYKFHYINNTNVKIEMMKFVVENGFSNNATIYRFITSDFYKFIFEPIGRNEKVLSRYFYTKWRSTHSWPINFVLRHCKSKTDKLRSMHQLLPKAWGIPYLCFVEKLLVVKNRIHCRR